MDDLMKDDLYEVIFNENIFFIAFAVLPHSIFSELSVHGLHK